MAKFVKIRPAHLIWFLLFLANKTNEREKLLAIATNFSHEGHIPMPLGRIESRIKNLNVNSCCLQTHCVLNHPAIIVRICFIWILPLLLPVFVFLGETFFKKGIAPFLFCHSPHFLIIWAWFLRRIFLCVAFFPSNLHGCRLFLWSPKWPSPTVWNEN